MPERDEPLYTVQLYGDTAVKRLDHVHSTLEEIGRHADNDADAKAAESAQEVVETVQEDIREIEEWVKEGQEDESG